MGKVVRGRFTHAGRQQLDDPEIDGDFRQPFERLSSLLDGWIVAERRLLHVWPGFNGDRL